MTRDRRLRPARPIDWEALLPLLQGMGSQTDEAARQRFVQILCTSRTYDVVTLRCRATTLLGTARKTVWTVGQIRAGAIAPRHIMDGEVGTAWIGPARADSPYQL